MEKRSTQNDIYELPHSDSLDEWNAWGLKVVAALEQMRDGEKARIQQLCIIRKELKHKNKVLGFYKSRIQELEDRNMTFENSRLYKVKTFICGLIKCESKNK
jgi:hypothetical protein